MFRYFWLTVLVFVAACGAAQVIPHTEAETLSGNKIVLPDAAAGHPAIFIVGFSRAGGESCSRWDKQLRQELGPGNSSWRIYNVAELQEAPKMVRGLIRHGMRGSVPKDEQDAFVLLYKDENVWKKLVDFSEPDDAYILLVDAADNIRWRRHGKNPDEQTVKALKDEMGKIAGGKP